MNDDDKLTTVRMSGAPEPGAPIPPPPCRCSELRYYGDSCPAHPLALVARGRRPSPRRRRRN